MGNTNSGEEGLPGMGRALALLPPVPVGSPLRCTVFEGEPPNDLYMVFTETNWSVLPLNGLIRDSLKPSTFHGGELSSRRLIELIAWPRAYSESHRSDASVFLFFLQFGCLLVRPSHRLFVTDTIILTRCKKPRLDVQSYVL